MKNIKIKPSFAIEAIIFAAWAVFIIAGCGARSLSSDEFFSYFYVNGGHSLFKALSYNAQLTEITPPLFNAILWIWNKIFPSTPFWLRLLPTLLTIAGTAALIAAAYKHKGEAFARTIGLFAMFSLTAVNFAAYELRTYGLFYFSVCLAMLSYVGRIKNSERLTPISDLVFGLSLTLVLYSHYFGIFTIAVFFLSDLAHCLLKRMKLLNVVSYAVPAALIAPWAIVVAVNRINGFSTFWPSVPTYKTAYATLITLFNFDAVLFVLFAVACVFAVATLISRLKRGDKRADLLSAVYSIGFWLVFLALFVYSSRINKRASVWVNRYMLCIYPFGLWTLADFLSAAVERVGKYNEYKLPVHRIAALILALSFILPSYFNYYFKYSGITVPTATENYDGAFKWLSENADPASESAAILTTDESYPMNGWREYYFGDSPVVCLSAHSADDVESISAYSTIILVRQHNPSLSSISKKAQAIIDAEYSVVKEDKKLLVAVYKKIS